MIFTAAGVLRGVKRVAPLALFALPFGIAYGAAAVAAGLTAKQAVAASVFVFSGAAQFSALELISGSGSLSTLALLTFAVSARHLIFGAVLTTRLRQIGWGGRLASLLLISDVNFADSQAAFRSGERDMGILAGGGLALWLVWCLGTSAGAFAGQSLGDLSRFGLDLVMACFFVSVVVGQARKEGFAAPLIGGLAAVASLSIAPVGWNIVLGAVIGGIVGGVFYRAAKPHDDG